MLTPIDDRGTDAPSFDPGTLVRARFILGSLMSSDIGLALVFFTHYNPGAAVMHGVGLVQGNGALTNGAWGCTYLKGVR